MSSQGLGFTGVYLWTPNVCIHIYIYTHIIMQVYLFSYNKTEPNTIYCSYVYVCAHIYIYMFLRGVYIGINK